ncbi:MAG: TetR family transcriptional regulator [Alphaproteobacteria bacterium]|nr:TetR family transcriptional regulator [Alphaproteobacteria bacterium]
MAMAYETGTNCPFFHTRIMAKDTREKLINAAIELFWLQGYGMVSVDDICKAAGVQKGSFYHYFRSKIDLTVATFEAMRDLMRTHMDEIFAAGTSPAEKISAYCAMTLERQKEKQKQYGRVIGCPFMTYGAELCTQDETVHSKVSEIFNGYAGYFERLMREAAEAGLCAVDDPAAAAQEMVAYIGGVLVQARIMNDIEVIRQNLETGLMRYLKTEPRSRAA